MNTSPETPPEDPSAGPSPTAHTGHVAASAGPPAWEEPLPLSEPHLGAPELAPDLLPDALRGWLTEAAESLCVPLEMVAVPAIVALGATTGRSIGVQLKQHAEWITHPNLWGAIIAPPSSMKSPALDEGLKPLQTLSRELALEHARNAPLAEAKLEHAERRLQELKATQGTPSEPPDLGEQLHALTEQCHTLSRGPVRFITNDATTEKLGEILSDNPRGILVVRDELTAVFETFNKRGREGDRQFYLEGFNATAGYHVDRIGRGSQQFDLCLSLLGGIQPGPMQAHVLSAISGNRNADGFLQRLQLAVVPTIKPYEHVDRPHDKAAWQRACAIYRILATADPAEFGAEPNPSERTSVIRLSETAQRRFAAWDEQHRNRLRGPEFEATPILASHLEKYPALLGKLALIFHLISVAEGATPGPVALGAVELAIKWLDFLEEHARRLYAAETAGLSPRTMKIATGIVDGSIPNRASVRSLQRTVRGSRAELNNDIELLVEKGWFRVDQELTGGRPTDIITVNPHLTNRN